MWITWTEMGSYTLIIGVLKIFFSFGGFCPALIFYPLGPLSYGAFVHCGFSLSAHVIAWRECWLSTPVSSDHMNRNGIVHLDCYNIKIFSLLGVLSTLIFILWGFCPIVLLSIVAFSLSTHVIAWRECWLSTPVSCDHMNRKWDRTPWLLEFQNIFSFGCFVRFDFYPLDLLSYGAFVHFGFSLSTHVIAWRECWLSTPVSCDHMNRNGIVHLDCWSIKIFSLLVVLSALILSFVPFVLWCFCPFWLFSVRPHDRMTRMLIVHTCIMWSHVQKKIWSYTLIVYSIKIFFSFECFCPLWFLSFGAFVLWCFCPFWRFSVRPRDRMTRNVDCPHLYHVITWREMGSYTLIVGVLTLTVLVTTNDALQYFETG